MSNKCTGGGRTELEVEPPGDCSPCVGIAKVTVNGDGTVTITLTNGQSTTFNAMGPQGPPGPTLSDEAWKTVGDAGFMANAQPIPGFIAGASVDPAANTFSLRKTSDGRLAIRGGLAFVAGMGAGNAIQELPTGYRPSVNCQLIAYANGMMDDIVFCNISNAGQYIYLSSGSIALGPNEVLRFPEQIISLD